MMALALLPLIGTAWLGIEGANWWPLALVTTMSLLTVLAYAHDKRQAIRGGWRIPVWPGSSFLIDRSGGRMVLF